MNQRYTSNFPFSVTFHFYGFLYANTTIHFVLLDIHGIYLLIARGGAGVEHQQNKRFIAQRVSMLLAFDEGRKLTEQ